MQSVPLGDQAVLVYLADEPAAVRLAAAVRAAAPPWLHDVVPAYSSVGVFFDADQIGVGEVMGWVTEVEQTPPPNPLPDEGEGEAAGNRRGSARLGASTSPLVGEVGESAGRAGWGEAPGLPPTRRSTSFRGDLPHKGGGEEGEPSEAFLTRRVGSAFLIPVCYEFGPDLPAVAAHVGLPADEVIRLHTAAEYTVYAIGFVPGFPYLGYLPPGLCGVPRLASPRLRVGPGSVGVTGRQTAVYPLARPGGWPLIGRTPLVLVDVADGFFPLRVGDRVRFARIDEREYRDAQGERVVPGEPRT